MKNIDACQKPFVIDADGKLYELNNGKKMIKTMSIKVKSVTMRNGAIFIVDENCKLWTYGDGKYGQLGHGNTERKEAPTLVEELKHLDVGQISICFSRVFCTTSCGKAYAWGSFGFLNQQTLPIELERDNNNQI